MPTRIELRTTVELEVRRISCPASSLAEDDAVYLVHRPLQETVLNFSNPSGL